MVFKSNVIHTQSARRLVVKANILEMGEKFDVWIVRTL